MPNVAVLDISQTIIDRSMRPSITISEDNICTITFKLMAAKKSDGRTPPEKEKGECRDANFGVNLVQNSPNKVKVKLVPEEKGGAKATLILEADLETKIPGTGSFLHTTDVPDKLNENYSASQID